MLAPATSRNILGIKLISKAASHYWEVKMAELIMVKTLMVLVTLKLSTQIISKDSKIYTGMFKSVQ